MSSKWIKRAAGIIVLLLIGAALVYAMLPQPVPVDFAIIDRGPLEVTIDEEGLAHIRDVFEVSAPVAGRVDRLSVEAGDPVKKDETVLASIHPTDPPFLDIRTRRTQEAAIGAAEAAVEVARAQLASAETARDLARSALDRAQQLAANQTISVSAFEKASGDLAAAGAGVDEARAALGLRQAELTSARARMIEPGADGQSADCCLTVKSPIDGIVLKLKTESEQVIAAGAPLLELGDPQQMEVIVHLLSSDAVKVTRAMPARLDGWGGGTLNAYVRRIEPAAYTKISALGIEEQRVDVRLDLADPFDAWRRLGHEFRVMAHLVVWRGGSVVRLPLGALYRQGADWYVYRVADGKAVATKVNIGHRNIAYAEVITGIGEGDTVVLHPSDRVADGVSIEARQ
ncbi:MAG TPA: HlyD family efflux transporter periplasmic adaptor subunit [Bauldia sp.]|nr:HlyD family efflux transporter periplasmic adaptor subunit [Bauldia sp.]